MLNELCKYCKKHCRYCIGVIIALVMAFGFHATQYTYHIDMLVDEYYNGTALIGAGRFSAPLIHYFTNWMSFAPFWHTIAMAIILFFAGAIYAIGLKKASGDKLSDVSVFAFWIIFSTFPIICHQLTYPILSVVLPYCLIGIIIWKLLPVFEGESIGKTEWMNIVLLLVVSVDMYESHAAVFLTSIFAVLLVKFHYTESDYLKSFKGIVCIVIKIVIALTIAIVLDVIISKIVCFLLCGTFEFWYSKNTTIEWLERPFFDCLKWLFREFVGKYLIAGVTNYNVLIYNIAIITGLIISIVLAKKKRTIWYLLLCIAMIISSFALSFVIGNAADYRMAQPMPIFVAFFCMIVMEILARYKKKTIALIILGVMIINQTLLINRYTVINYQRHQYENNILVNIAEDLRAYDTENKDIIFISDSKDMLPEFTSTPMELGNPVFNKCKEFMCSVYDTVIPDTVYRRLSERYATDLSGAEKVARFYNKERKNLLYTPFNTRDSSGHFAPEIYAAFNRLGYSYKGVDRRISELEYVAFKEKYIDLPAYPENGYIQEYEDFILVKIYGDKQENNE